MRTVHDCVWTNRLKLYGMVDMYDINSGLVSIHSRNTFKSSHRKCSVKKVLLEISQNSLENTIGNSPVTLSKKLLKHECVPAILWKS